MPLLRHPQTDGGGVHPGRLCRHRRHDHRAGRNPARSVAARKNILVAGGTSTGKTTLTNALLAEVAKTADRVVLIEDTHELQCRSPNLVALRTKDGGVSLSDLVRSALRLRPDRILIGDRTDRMLRLIDGFVPEVAWLDDGETLTHLHSTISTKTQRVRAPEIPMHLGAGAAVGAGLAVAEVAAGATATSAPDRITDIALQEDLPAG